jgi:hypothetical protein
MRILLDECLPRRLKRHLGGHDVKTVVEMGWGGLKNGNLLLKVEGSFDLFLTADQNLPYQQNLTGGNVRVVVLCSKSNAVSDLEPLMPDVMAALSSLQPGEVRRIGKK